MTKRNDLRLSQQLNVLQLLDQNKSQSEVAKEFGCSQSQISRIYQQRELIETKGNENGNKDTKRKRAGKDADVEEALKQWYVHARDNNVKITGAILMEKAEDLAKGMNKEFHATIGWLCRWKARNGLSKKDPDGKAYEKEFMTSPSDEKQNSNREDPDDNSKVIVVSEASEAASYSAVDVEINHSQTDEDRLNVSTVASPPDEDSVPEEIDDDLPADLSSEESIFEYSSEESAESCLDDYSDDDFAPMKSKQKKNSEKVRRKISNTSQKSQGQFYSSTPKMRSIELGASYLENVETNSNSEKLKDKSPQKAGEDAEDSAIKEIDLPEESIVEYSSEESAESILDDYSEEDFAPKKSSKKKKMNSSQKSKDQLKNLSISMVQSEESCLEKNSSMEKSRDKSQEDKKIKVFGLSQKMKILELFDQKMPQFEIAKKFSCCTTQIHQVCKDRKEIEAEAAINRRWRKKGQVRAYPEIDKALKSWYDEAITKNEVTNLELLAKMQELAKENNIHFHKITGLLHRWKVRHRFPLKKYKTSVKYEEPKSDMTKLNSDDGDEGLYDGLTSKGRKKKKDLTLSQKLEVLQLFDQMMPRCAIAKMFDISRTQVFTIHRTRKQIEGKIELDGNSSTRKKRRGQYPELDAAMKKWHDEVEASNEVIKSDDIIEKALAVAKEMKLDFLGSKSWLRNWKRRNGISTKVPRKKTKRKPDSSCENTEVASVMTEEYKRHEETKLQNDIAHDNAEDALAKIKDERLHEETKIPDGSSSGESEEAFKNAKDDELHEEILDGSTCKNSEETSAKAKKEDEQHKYPACELSLSNSKNNASAGDKSGEDSSTDSDIGVYSDEEIPRKKSNDRSNELNLGQKLEVLKMIDQRISKDTIAKKFNCGRTQIFTVNRNRKDIESRIRAGSSILMKRKRTGRYPEVDEALKQWYDKTINKTKKIPRIVIMRKAEEIGKKLNIHFCPTIGWLERWKLRFNVSGCESGRKILNAAPHAKSDRKSHGKEQHQASTHFEKINAADLVPEENSRNSSNSKDTVPEEKQSTNAARSSNEENNPRDSAESVKIQEDENKKGDLTFKERCTILELLDDNITVEVLAEMFDCSKSKIDNVNQNRGNIKAAKLCNVNANETKKSPIKYPEIDKALKKWYDEAKTSNGIFSQKIMEEKAEEIAKEMNIEFYAQSDWIRGWKLRNGILKDKYKGSVNEPEAQEQMSPELDTALRQWYMYWKEDKIKIKESILTKKAEELAKNLNMELHITSDWISRWKGRNNIIEKDLRISDKVKVLELLDQNLKFDDIAKRFKRPRVLIANILLKRKEIQDDKAKVDEIRRELELHAELTKWYIEVKTKSGKIKRRAIREKADEITKKMNMDFHVTKDWVRKWKSSNRCFIKSTIERYYDKLKTIKLKNDQAQQSKWKTPTKIMKRPKPVSDDSYPPQKKLKKLKSRTKRRKVLTAKKAKRNSEDDNTEVIMVKRKEMARQRQQALAKKLALAKEMSKKKNAAISKPKKVKRKAPSCRADGHASMESTETTTKRSSHENEAIENSPREENIERAAPVADGLGRLKYAVTDDSILRELLANPERIVAETVGEKSIGRRYQLVDIVSPKPSPSPSFGVVMKNKGKQCSITEMVTRSKKSSILHSHISRIKGLRKVEDSC